MICKNCKSARISDINAKSDDRNTISVGNKEEHSCYVPRDMNIGGGDYVSFSYCLDCGMMQGNFPLPETELEQKETEDNEW